MFKIWSIQNLYILKPWLTFLWTTFVLVLYPSYSRAKYLWGYKKLAQATGRRGINPCSVLVSPSFKGERKYLPMEFGILDNIKGLETFIIVELFFYFNTFVRLKIISNIQKIQNLEFKSSKNKCLKIQSVSVII